MTKSRYKLLPTIPLFINQNLGFYTKLKGTPGRLI
jgi:hypothetical protein